MNFFSRIMNSFRSPDLPTRICQILSSTSYVDQHQSSILMSQLISHTSPQSIILQLTQQLSTSSHISRIKFTSMLLLSQQTNNLHEFTDILHLKLLKTQYPSKNPIETQSQKIVSNLLFYFIRSIKKQYKQQIKQGLSDSTITMNRLYINFAYKFMNQINSLLNLEPTFLNLLRKHAGVPYLEQIYVLIVKELNLLYQCFKHSMNYYFTGFDKEQVIENIEEIRELIVTNKQIYRKMRQFHGISDFVTKTKEKEKFRIVEKLVEYADVPYNVYKWFSKISKIQTSKLANTSTDMFASGCNIQTINTMSHITLDQ